ncbi:MAG TPA: hypothetical protein VNT54_00780 [Solirubrobacteraceae bacterium]|nr:hypothetical protein [Solirubrobacteraceae bacterium]
MTASDARRELGRLTTERLVAIEAGRWPQRDLHVRIEQELSAYIGLAVTEIATLRGELSGRPSG